MTDWHKDGIGDELTEVCRKAAYYQVPAEEYEAMKRELKSLRKIEKKYYGICDAIYSLSPVQEQDK